MWTPSSTMRSDDRGGLGGDPQAAPVRGDADQGDRAQARDLAERGAEGAGGRQPAEVLAAGEGVAGGCGGAADPSAAGAVADDAGDGDRRADRLGALADGLEGPAAGAAAGVPPAGSSVAHELSGRRARAVRSVVSAGRRAAGRRAGRPPAGAGDGLGLLAMAERAAAALAAGAGSAGRALAAAGAAGGGAPRAGLGQRGGGRLPARRGAPAYPADFGGSPPAG